MSIPYEQADLVKIAVSGDHVDAGRVLATYADERNWEKVYDENGAHWCWKGPVIVGFELARWVKPN